MASKELDEEVVLSSVEGVSTPIGATAEWGAERGMITHVVMEIGYELRSGHDKSGHEKLISKSLMLRKDHLKGTGFEVTLGAILLSYESYSTALDLNLLLNRNPNEFLLIEYSSANSARYISNPLPSASCKPHFTVATTNRGIDDPPRSFSLNLR